MALGRRRSLGGSLSPGIVTAQEQGPARQDLVFAAPPPRGKPKPAQRLSTSKTQTVYSPTYTATSSLPAPAPRASTRPAPEYRVAQQTFRPIPHAPAGILGRGVEPMRAHIDQVGTGVGSGRTMVPLPVGVGLRRRFAEAEAQVPQMQKRPHYGLKTGPSKTPAAPPYEAGEPTPAIYVNQKPVTPTDMQAPDPASAPAGGTGLPSASGGSVKAGGASGASKPTTPEKPKVAKSRAGLWIGIGVAIAGAFLVADKVTR